MNVFLIQTDQSQRWRNILKKNTTIVFYDPATAENQATTISLELLHEQRERCDYLLYVITPQLSDLDIISQLVDDSNKHPDKTLFCFTETEGDKKFNTHQIKSLKAIGNMINNNGAKWIEGLENVASFLESCKSTKQP